MAYAAILSVMQKLKYLLQFSYMILRVKKLKVEMFDITLSKLDESLHSLSSSCVMHLIEDALNEVNSVELGSGEFIPQSKHKIPFTLQAITRRLISDIYLTPSETSGMKFSRVGLDKMLQMTLDQYETMFEGTKAFCCYLSDSYMLFTEGELDKYFDRLQTFCSKIYDCISSMVASEKFDHDVISKMQELCQAVDKLKNETTFFYSETLKIEGLNKDLDFLLDFLKDSANVSKIHGQVKCFEKFISNVAYRAEDIIEEKLLVASFESKLRKITEKNIELRDVHAFVQTLIDNIFDKEHGIIPCLYSTFIEIDSIKRKVRTFVDETLGIRNFLPEMVLNCGSVDGLIKEDIVVGLDSITEVIVDRLTGQPSGLEILSIIGMGGCGKTTLARKVFEHPFTVYHFYCRGWIAISQVYQVRDLLLHLLCSITQPTNEIYEKDKEQLAEQLYRSLKGRRYLIVIDDIWSFNAWDDIKKSFPNDRNGSRILLTSRLKGVVVSISPKWPPYCISPLTVDESSELLHKKVFGKESCPQE